MQQPKKRSLLADMARDMVDAAKTLAMPFMDFAADVKDAHSFAKHKRMLTVIQKKLLTQPKKITPIVMAKVQRTTAFAWPKITTWIARPRRLSLPHEEILKHAPSLPTLIIPAAIIGIPLALLTFCDACRKKTFSLFFEGFHLMVAIGKQVRLDTWDIIHWARSLIDAFRHRVPDRQTLRHAFSKPLCSAKKSFAKFVLAAKNVRLPSIALPRLELPRLEFPSIVLPSFKLPRIEMPRLSLSRLRQPLFTLPRIETPVFSLPRIIVPSIKLPRLSLPTFSIPRFTFPKIHIPQFHVPRIALPVFTLPHLIIPRFKIPQLTIPHIVLNVPQFKLPHLKIPQFRIPQLRLPRIEMPTISLPRLQFQSFHLPSPKIESPFISFRLLYKNFLAKQSRRHVLENNGSSNNYSFHLPPKRPKRTIPFWKKYYLTEFVALAVVVGTVGVFISIFAAANRTNFPITYQGRLMNQNYVPLSDTERYIAFEIYDALTGGTCVWRTATLGSDTANTCDGLGVGGPDPEALAVTPSRGLFTVTLGTGVAGSDNPEITNNFQTDDYYLQVKVCTTTGATSCETLTPRKQLGGVPYAYHAFTVDTLNPPTTVTYTGTSTLLTLTANSITANKGIALSTTGLTSGIGISFTGPSSETAGITGSAISLTSDIGANGELLNLAPTIDDSTGGSGYSIYSALTNSATSTANIAYGIYNSLTDAVALGNTNYGTYTSLTNTGALTAAATKTLYGDYISVSGSGASTSATTNVYGSYITTTATHSADSGTINNYGLYIANGTSSTSGTSKKYGLYVASQTGADDNYAAVFAGGNVGIGTTSPTQRLTLDQGIFLLTTGGNPSIVTGLSTTQNIDIKTIALSGRYAYVGTAIHASENEFKIIDLTVLDEAITQSPKVIGSVDQATDVNTIAAAGRYAYVGIGTAAIAGTCSGATVTGCEFRIYDVSNPASPSAVGGFDVGQEVSSIAVSGKFAVIAMGTVNAGTCSGTTVTGCEFIILDISNPATPAAVGGYDVGYALKVIAFSGRYAYLGQPARTGTCSGATVTGCEFTILDIADPSSPTAKSGVDLNDTQVTAIQISGRYAYTTQDNNSAAEFRTIDISDPAGAAAASTYDIGATANDAAKSVALAGNYAYVGKAGDGSNQTCSGATVTGCEILIIDISNPQSLSAVGGINTHDGTADRQVNALALTGSYLLSGSAGSAAEAACSISSTSGCELKVINVHGIVAPSATLGTLTLNVFNADNGFVNNNLIIGNSLLVGVGGLFSQGPITINSLSTGTSQGALDIKNSGGTNLFYVRDDGVIMINSTTAYGRQGQLFEINKAGSEGGLAFNTYVGSSVAALLDFNKSRGTAVGTHTAVQLDDALGNITFRGSDGGSAFRDSAGIAANIDGSTISSTSMPGRLVFFTTLSGSVSLSERMRIDNKGHVEFNQPTAPTLEGGGCGTSPALISDSTDMVGRITVGTGTPTSCKLNFNQTWTNIPSCFGNNASSTMAVRAAPTTTAVTFYASFNNSDELNYWCVGYR